MSFLDGHSLAATGKPIVQPKRPPAKGEYWQNDLDWSPDGRLLAITYFLGRISVWDTTTGTLVVNLPQKPHAVQAAFTPDGSLLVTGGNTGIPSFWDTRTWKLVTRPAQGHGSALVGMSVDPAAGRWPPSAMTTGTSSCGTSPRVARSARRFTGDASHVPGARLFYSSDGRRLLAFSGLGRITVWDVDPESWKRRACSIAGRNLSRDEWRDFVGDTPYHATCP